MNDDDDTGNYDRIPYLENIWYFFYFKYIYTGYNQSVKLFYLGALSKT